MTLQSLHDRHFDHGTILRQTRPPGFEIPNAESCTVAELRDLVSDKGAQMLVGGIRDGVFVPPLEPAGWPGAAREDALIHARKIRTGDQQVDWLNWTWTEISKRSRVLGPLWTTAGTAPHRSGDGHGLEQKRVILTSLAKVERPRGFEGLSQTVGVPFVEGRAPFEQRQDGKGLYVFTRDGSLIRIQEMKVEGERVADGFRAALKARMVGSRTVRVGDGDYTLFHEGLGGVDRL